MMKFLQLLTLVSIAYAIQPRAVSPQPSDLRPLRWGILNFLQTTDTHGWHAGHLQEAQFSADWGDYVSFTKHMRDLADSMGVDLLVVDTGDRIEGNGLSDASEPKGKYVREVFKHADMDIITIGNHELYKEASSANDYMVMRPYYGDKWVVSNVEIYAPDSGELVPMGHKYRKFKTKNMGITIMAFGFLFDFTGNWNNTVVTTVEEEIKSPWFQTAIRDPTIDIFVVVGHTPVRGEFPEYPSIFTAIRSVRPHIPIQFIGGHTHIRDFTIYDSSSTGLESGRYCETVGFVSISHIRSARQPQTPAFHRRYIDFNRFSFANHSQKGEREFDTPEGLQVSRDITRYRDKLGLDKLYGCAPKDYFLSRVPYGHPDSLYTLLADEVLPAMVKGQDREDIPRLIYINTGSQRFDILKGPFTYDASFTVSPFTSTFHYIPSVPYTIAKKLLELFNDDISPWFTATSKSKTSLGPLEPHFHFSKLWNLASQNKHNRRDLPNMQYVLDELDNASPPTADDRPDTYTITTDVSDDDVCNKCTPGYTTHDDAGSSGDDTPHSRIPMYNPGNVIAANVSFPFSGHDPEAVDLVFLDFIEKHVLSGLQHFGGNYTHADVSRYMDDSDTLTSLMRDWVGSQWGKDCM